MSLKKLLKTPAIPLPIVVGIDNQAAPIENPSPLNPEVFVMIPSTIE